MFIYRTVSGHSSWQKDPFSKKMGTVLATDLVLASFTDKVYIHSLVTLIIGYIEKCVNFIKLSVLLEAERTSPLA